MVRNANPELKKREILALSRNEKNEQKETTANGLMCMN